MIRKKSTTTKHHHISPPGSIILGRCILIIYVILLGIAISIFLENKLVWLWDNLLDHWTLAHNITFTQDHILVYLESMSKFPFYRQSSKHVYIQVIPPLLIKLNSMTIHLIIQNHILQSWKRSVNFPISWYFMSKNYFLYILKILLR